MDYDFNLLANLTIGGTAAVPLIIGIVALLKQLKWLGPDDKYAPYAAGGLAVVAYVVVELLKVYPAFITYASPIAASVYIFLVVSGVYKLAKKQ